MINAVAAKAGLSKAGAKKALDAVLESVKKTVKGGGKVALVGFGTFYVAQRKARTGRNPQTGKAINIKAKKVVKFKAGSGLAL